MIYFRWYLDDVSVNVLSSKCSHDVHNMSIKVSWENKVFDLALPDLIAFVPRSKRSKKSEKIDIYGPRNKSY